MLCCSSCKVQAGLWWALPLKSDGHTELKLCCSLQKVQAVAHLTTGGLAILQMLADTQGSLSAGRVNQQQSQDLAEMAHQSWAAGQDGDRQERELLWKLLR